jgi:purine-binding chemotaxis protein CheW
MRGKQILETVYRQKGLSQAKMEHRDMLKISLDEGWYGISIADVVEVINCPRIFNIPNTPDHVIGVVNLRGEILATIDIRRLLGLSTQPSELQKHIVVIERDNIRVGIMVDRAADVVSILESAIAPPLSSGVKSLILGEARLDGETLFGVNSEFQSDLDSKYLSAALLKEFGDRGRSLSDKATIVIEKTGNRWLIADPPQIYSIRKEEDELKVYDEEILSILDLDVLKEEEDKYL